MTNCTAPVEGHTLPVTALRCPVHGAAMMSAAGIKSLPPLPPSSVNSQMGTFAWDVDTNAEEIIALAASSSDEDRRFAARAKRTPDSVLFDLAWDDTTKVRRDISKRKRCPATALTVLSTDSDIEIQAWVATHTDTPPEVLGAMLLESKAERIRACAAGNPSTAPEALRATVDNDLFVLAAIGNPGTPSDVIARFESDTTPLFREAVAGNPSAAADVVMRLAESRKASVRFAAATNPALPEHVQEALLYDDAKNGRNTIDHRDERVWHGLSQNTTLGTQTIDKFFERVQADGSDSADARMADIFLTNPNVSSALIQRGADDGWAEARSARVARIVSLGVDERNRAAINALASQEWWSYEKDGAEVRLVLVAHSDL